MLIYFKPGNPEVSMHERKLALLAVASLLAVIIPAALGWMPIFARGGWRSFRPVAERLSRDRLARFGAILNVVTLIVILVLIPLLWPL